MFSRITKRYGAPISLILCISLIFSSIGFVAGVDADSQAAGSGLKNPTAVQADFKELTAVLRGWRMDLERMETYLDQGKEAKAQGLINELLTKEKLNQEYIRSFRESLVREHSNLVGRFDKFVSEFQKGNEESGAFLKNLSEGSQVKKSLTTREIRTDFKKVLKHREKHWLGRTLSHRSISLKNKQVNTNRLNLNLSMIGDTTVVGGSAGSPQLPAGITDPAPQEADRALTLETAVSAALRAKVRELGRDPVRIYEFVRNKIEYEPYYGSLKGADKTLTDLAGNDLDQSALLVTLYRMAGIPSRFVFGQVSLNIKQAQQWLGAKSPAAALAMLQRNGIPATPITAGGVYTGVEFDHAWVQAYLPALPERSIKERLGDAVWIDLDPSIKELILAPRQDLSAVVGVDPRSLLNEARNQSQYDRELGSATGVPQDLLLGKVTGWAQMIRRYADANNLTGSDLGQIVRITQVNLGQLPLSQPWKEISSAVYHEVPDVLRHTVTFKLADSSGSNLVTVTRPLLALNSKKIAFTSKPATAEDQKILADMADETSLPAYLINVIPEVTIGQERVLQGKVTGLGQISRLTVELAGPTTGIQRAERQFVTGTAAAIVLDQGGQSLRGCFNNLSDLRQAKEILAKGNTLEPGNGVIEALETIGKSYFYQLDELNKLNAAALDVRVTRHPSVMIASYEMSTEDLYGVPYSANAESVSIDVITDLISPISRSGNWVLEKQFLATSGLTASALEHSVLEAVLDGNAVSTVRVLEAANQLKVPILTIKPESLETSLAALNITVRNKTEAMIRDAANAGYWVIIPRDETSFAGWQGIGCIILDPYTNAASYQISGGLQGGISKQDLLTPAALLDSSKVAGVSTLLSKALNWNNIIQTRVEEMRWSYMPGIAAVSDWMSNAQNMDEVTTIAAAIVISGPISLICQSLSVLNARCYPEIFSPNNDGAADSAQLTADLTREATWEVTVRNLAGEVQRVTSGRGRQIAESWKGEISTGPALQSGEYTLQVTAKDVVTGQKAASQLLLVQVDLTAPTAEIKEPADGASVKGSIRFLGTANDLHFNRFTLEGSTGDGNWQTLAADTQPVIDNTLALLDTTTIANGEYTLRLTAYDTAGNQTVLTQKVTIANPTVDKTPPTCSLIQPAAGTTVAGQVTLTAQAADDTGIAGVDFLVDGNKVGSITVAPYTLSIDAGKFDLGQHQLQARARDLAGHITDSTAVAVTFGGLIHNFKIAPNPFSPNGDGSNETATISAMLSESKDWKVEIVELDGTGAVQASKTGSGTVVDWVWDGKDAQGTLQPTGTYLVRLSAGTENVSETLILNQDGERPIAIISSPKDQDELGGQIQVLGVAADSDFKSYELKYRRQGAGAWTTLVVSETPVTNGLLGTLDATLLGNDFYEIQLTTWDQKGQGTITTVTVAVTGDMKVGNFKFSLLDMQVNVGNINVAVIRSYDTLDRDVTADYGYGWKFTLSTAEVKEDPYHNIIVTMPDGRRARFAFTPNFPAGGYQNVLAYPGYTQATGYPEKLSVLDVPVVIFAGGQYLVPGEYGGTDEYCPKKFRLDTSDGKSYFIDRDFGVTKVIDINGDFVEITPDGVKTSSGKQIVITRDSGSRITKVIDPSQVEVNYEYSADGDLVAYTDASGRRVTYTYKGHALTGIFDYDGKQLMANDYDESGRIKEIRDAAGNKVQINHDFFAKQDTVIDRNGNPTVYGYDENGRVIHKTDALGNTWAYAYDAQGHKLMETDPLGRTTYYSYAPNGEIASETDPAGNISGNTFGSVFQGTCFATIMTSSTDKLGRVTSYGYSGTNMTSIKDPLGNETKIAYSGGNISSYTDPAGNSYTFEYSGSLPTKVTDPAGNVTDSTYDEAGRIKTETRYRTKPDGTTESLKTEYFYDNAGRVIRVVRPDGSEEQTEYSVKGQVSAKTKAGKRTEYLYNDNGQLWKTTYPDGTYEEQFYDANGNRTSLKGRDGQTTAFIYDAANRLVKTVYPDNSCTETRYDAAGQVIAEIDLRGGVTEYQYNELGQKVKEINPLGYETTYAYDLVGNQTTVTDLHGVSTSFDYDAGNRLVRVNYPDGNRASYEYDAAGRKVSQTDQLYNKTQYAYDGSGRLTGVTDAIGGVTSYVYDSFGKMIAQTDANKHTTKFTYDVMGRLLEKILPLGQKENYEYNSDGSLKAKTDCNGKRTDFTYDPVTSQLIKKAFTDGTQVSYTYYPDGRIKTATNINGTISFQFDIMGRLKQYTDPNSKTISYDYDNAGNLIKVSAPHGVAQYAYDLLGRIETVTDQAGKVSRYQYDDMGRQAKVSYANGTEAVYKYDNLNRLTELVNKKSTGEIITSHKYTLDAVGYRTQIEEKDSTVRYVYDKLYRLIEENRTGSIIYNAVYTYDPVGNRLTKNGTDGSFTYNYDDNDRLLSDGKNTYGWDDNGNLITRTGPDGVITYSYDPENKLVEATGPDKWVKFAYDAQGNRIGRSTAGETTSFLVDTNQTYAQVLEETTGGVTKVYTYGNDLIKSVGSNNESWYSYDGLGSTQALTNDNGALTDEYLYEAFGNPVNRTGSSSNDYMFTGEQFDPGLGMYYLRARYYDPAIGRFNSRDPLGSLLQGSFYRYCSNDPVNNVDPTGKLSLVELMYTISAYATTLAMAYPRAATIITWALEAVIPFEVQIGLPNCSVLSGEGVGVLLAGTKELSAMRRLFKERGGFAGLGTTFENWVKDIIKAERTQVIIKGGKEIKFRQAGSAVIDFIKGNSVLEIKLSGSAIKMNQAKQLAKYADESIMGLTYIFFKKPSPAEEALLRQWIDEAVPGFGKMLEINWIFQ